MSISESLTTVRELCNGKEWFNDVVPGDHDRIIVCVNHMDNETHTLIPDFINNHQVLVHYASYYSIDKDKYTDKQTKLVVVNDLPIPSRSGLVSDVPAPDFDFLVSELDRLERIGGSNILFDVFFEEHDGKNAVTNLSAKYPEIRKSIHDLYEIYGFDIIYDELEG